MRKFAIVKVNVNMVSVIIINWNGKKWLKECLDSIKGQSYPDYEIIVFDNASTDGSIDFLENNYPEARILKSSGNIGFGPANNLAAKEAKGELLFFLNNDTVLEKKTIEELVKFKNKERLNIVGPKMLDFKGGDIYQGRKLSIDFTGYLGWDKETFFVEGCALMISKTDFENLGSFDKKYFMYSEDIDLCWRAQICGMKIGICDSAWLKHFGGGSGESTRLEKGQRHIVPVTRKYEVEKNNLRSILKNYRFRNIIWIISIFIFLELVESLIYIFTLNWKVLGVQGKAFFWNISNIGDTLREKRIIQKKRKVSDRQIFSKMIFWPGKIKAFWEMGWPKFK